jgi:hexosaminidase
MNREMKVPKRGFRARAAAMGVLAIALMSAAMIALPVSAAVAPSLIPMPKTVTPATGSFELTGSTPLIAASGEPERIAGYFADLVGRTTPVQLRAGGSGKHAIAFTLDSGAPTGDGYSISITSEGITLRAREARGLFYGAVSLWQLVTANATAEAGTVVLPAMSIDDSPRFVWRGLMLDVARHFMTPADIKRLLDQMALHKLNTFHWHLTDDQGWRLQIKKYPRLTDVGAWRVPAGSTPATDIDPKTGKPRLYGGFYTQDEVRDIVRYAADRFITVVPEIEMPGHAQSAIAAYPELGTEGARPQVSSDWGVHDYLFNVDEATFSFLESVLTEVMQLFPGQYIHIGGDEAAKNRWRASPRIQQRMRELGVANEAALQGYFTHRIEAFLRSQGRKLIGWDEILEGGLPAAATVMSWRGEAAAIEAVKGGHDVVMAPSPSLYLDYLQSAGPDEPPGRPRYVTLEDMYRFKVLPDAIARAAGGVSTRHVLGAQVNVWTEHMRTRERVEHAIFPRVAAFSEAVWTSAETSNWSGFIARLPAQFARYEKLGVAYADSAFAVQVSAAPSASPTADITMTLSNQLSSGDIRYTLDGSAPHVTSARYAGPIDVNGAATVNASTFESGQMLSQPRSKDLSRALLARRTSNELKSCSNKLPLRLEDDGPREGPRAVFNVDILDPCWIYERADLSRATSIRASVGRIPFNFQVGDDVKAIPLYRPRTPEGELEVRVDSCKGKLIATLPLAAAVETQRSTKAEIAALPPAKIASRAGAHDLCLRFTRKSVDPMWVIDSVQIVE